MNEFWHGTGLIDEYAQVAWGDAVSGTRRRCLGPTALAVRERVDLAAFGSQDFG